MRFCRPGGGRARSSWTTSPLTIADFSVLRDGLEALRHDVAMLPEEYRAGALERIDRTLKKVRKVRPRMRSLIYRADEELR